MVKYIQRFFQVDKFKKEYKKMWIKKCWLSMCMSIFDTFGGKTSERVFFFFFFIIFGFSSYANSITQRAVVEGEGTYFDKIEKQAVKGPLGNTIAYSKVDIKTASHGIKSWCFANCFAGGVRGSVRVFHFKTIRFQNIKPGTKFKANIKFKVALYGLINSTSFAYGDTFYKAKITAGILPGSAGNWGYPLAKALLWAKTNKKEWKDWGKDVLLATGEEVSQEAVEKGVEEGAKVAGATAKVASKAGTAAGIGVGVVLEAAQYALDALDVDEKIAQEAWVEFKDVPVEAGKAYRVYVNLDSLVTCAAIAAGTSYVYIDFFNHSPHFGDDNGRLLPQRGIEVKDVVVEIPKRLPWPKGVGPNRADLTIKSMEISPQEPKVGDVVNFKIKVSNKGAIEASNFSLSLKHNNKVLLEKPIDNLKKGETKVIEFNYKIFQTGSHKFTIAVDPENKIDELNEKNNTAHKEIVVVARPDLLVQYKDLPENPDVLAYGINSQDTYPQVGKLSEIWAKVYNFGNTDALNVKVIIKKDGKILYQTIIPKIRRGSFKRISTIWKPKRSGKHFFRIIVDPTNSIPELNEKNNSISFITMVNVADYDLSLGSLNYYPASLEAGRKVNFVIEVRNKGRLSAPVDILLYLNSILLKGISGEIPGGKTVVFGDGNPKGDLITWDAEAGDYILKAVVRVKGPYQDLNKKDNMLLKKISVPEFASIRGVDFVLRKKDVKFDGHNWKARIYNRGTKSASTTVQFKIFYPQEDKIVSRIIKTFATNIPAGKYKDLSFSYTPGGVFKMEIEVDPNNKVAERDESNNKVIYTRGNFEQKVEEIKEKKQKEEKMRERIPLEITRFTGFDPPIKVGEKRELGIWFKNVSGRDLKNILIEVEISNTQKGDNPKFGSVKYVRNWPLVRNKGEFGIYLPYKAVYPGKFKTMVKASVYFMDRRKMVRKEKYFLVKGGEYPSYYYKEKGVDLAILPNWRKMGNDMKQKFLKKIF